MVTAISQEISQYIIDVTKQEDKAQYQAVMPHKTRKGEFAQSCKQSNGSCFENG